jgi:large subunit ribosomal protein L15
MITLNTLKPADGANKGKKRLGRGHGSGLHKTAGKGTKGQKARTGHHGIPKPGFEGGQTSMARRLPKRGFRNPFRRSISCVNLGDICERFAGASSVSVSDLKARGLVPRAARYVKILSTVKDGLVLNSLKLEAHYISEAAQRKLQLVGGMFTKL